MVVPKLSDRPRGHGALDAAHRAAQMLRAPMAPMQLTENEVLAVASVMRQPVFKSGTENIRQHEKTVRSLVANRVNAAAIKVLGPGNLIGEMALLDGAARSAACTASAEVLCAVPTREALEALTTGQLAAAANLMTALARRLTDRLRESSQKRQVLSKLLLPMQNPA